MKAFEERKNCNCSFHWSAISLVAMTCGGIVLADDATNPMTATNATQLGNITVVGKLDQAHSQILSDLGATAYSP